MNEDLRDTVRLLSVDRKVSGGRAPFHIEFTKALSFVTYWLFLAMVLLGCVFVMDLILRAWPR